MRELTENKRYILFAVIGVLILFFIYSNFLATEEVKLYFSGPQAQYLVPEQRQVSVNNLAYNVVKELVKGPNQESLGVTIPPQTKLLKVEVEDKLAKVNFSKELVDNHWGGSTGEMMTVYSIVNTLTSLSNIEQVKILVSGNELQTLAGHLELRDPLKFNKRLIESKE